MAQRRNYVQIKTDGKRRLEAATPITNFSPTSMAGSLLDMIGRECEEAYNSVEDVLTMNDPTIAKGVFLENMGFMLGTTKNAAVKAQDNTTTNFNFYVDPRLGLHINEIIENVFPLNTHYTMRKKLVDDGFVDDINTPTWLKIVAGTTVSDPDEAITYTTINDVYLTNTIDKVFVEVVASVSGAGSNVPANFLVKHDMNSVAVLKNIAQYVLCSNVFPITSGANAPSDNQYRYDMTLSRISYPSNEISIRRAVLQIPGVRDILFERGRYGNGTFNIIVEGVTPIVSEGLLTVVKETVQALSGQDTVFVSRPEYLGMELNLDVYCQAGYDIGTVRNQVRQSIIQYINDLPLGETLIWNEIPAAIMNVPGVSDFVMHYFKLGEYDVYSKINTKQIVLRETNQRSEYNEKFYTDSGLISVCARKKA